MARGYVDVWAIEAGDHVVLVDLHYDRASGWLQRRLEREGIDPAGVDAVVVTHAHGDHAGGVVAWRAVSHAPVILGAKDVPIAAEGHNPPIRSTSLFARLVKPTIPMKYPSFAPDLVVDGELDLHPYGIPAVAREVGGHTPGSVIVVLDGGDVLVGDLIRGKVGAHHHPTEHLFEPDVAEVHRILRKILDDGATQLYPGHGDVLERDRVERWLARRERRDARNAR
jgi:glyoxylase-like metal-dependent hydrolase (beta-lactamase superfamily II)